LNRRPVLIKVFDFGRRYDPATILPTLRRQTQNIPQLTNLRGPTRRIRITHPTLHHIRQVLHKLNIAG